MNPTKWVEVTTQAELDAAVKIGHGVIITAAFNGRAVLRGSSRAVLWGSSRAVLRESSRAELRESSSAVLWESSRAELRGSPSAVLRGSSSAVLRESSSAVLRESSSVRAFGDAILRVFSALKIQASAHVVIKMHGTAKSITGGIRVKAAPLKTAKNWCDYHGAEVKRGVATVYKALNEDFTSLHKSNTSYAPGSKPTATDWDGGKAECGGGLHFSPTPIHALEFHSEGKKFIACGVALKDMRAPKADDNYPQKIKAKRVASACYEVDRYGKRA